MSIASEITRLQNAKASLKTSIENKGVTVPSATTLDGYAALVDAIPTGGGAVEPERDVNFIDYDGTILHSYTMDEAKVLSALPDNPSHDGLVALGWNWTLANIKTQATNYPQIPFYIGQLYTTTDGASEIMFELVGLRKSVNLNVCPNGTFSVDWGDGSTFGTITGTSTTVKKTVSHTYSLTGVYTIRLIPQAASAEVALGANSGTVGLLESGDAVNAWFLARSVIEIREGSNGYISEYGCYYMSNLKAVVMSGLKSGGIVYNNAFYGCQSLRAVVISGTTPEFRANAFYNCYSLNMISANPAYVRGTGLSNASGINYILVNRVQTGSSGASPFASCYKLRKVVYQGSQTALPEGTFSGCQSMTEAYLPNGITTVPRMMLYTCYSLTEFTVISSVTSFEARVFDSCTGLKTLTFEPTTPPTAPYTSVFSGIPTDCIIRVPSASLSSYTSATNYPSSSTYTYVGY